MCTRTCAPPPPPFSPPEREVLPNLNVPEDILEMVQSMISVHRIAGYSDVLHMHMANIV
jgi:hypothetical protein